MSRPTTILLAGYYGFGNTGDEAILAALLSGLRARVPSARAVVISGDPDSTRSQHGVEAVPWRDVAAIARAASECDLVILGGGGLFQDHWGVDPQSLLTPNHYGISFYAGPAVLAALAGKPLVLLGVGFGPLASPKARRLVRGVCEAASYLSARDADSRDLLVASGVAKERITLSADAAFGLPASPGFGAQRLLREAGVEARSPLVAVALRSWAIGVDPEAWEVEVAGALDRLIEKTGGSLLFVPFQKSGRADEDDAGVAARVRRRLSPASISRAVELREPLPPSQTRGLLASCDLVVAMRLHAAVFAIADAVPLVGIAYDPKVAALLGRLELQSLIEPLGAISGWSLQARMESALEAGDGLRRRLADASADLARLAAADLAAAASFLDAAAPFLPPPVTDAQRELFGRALAASVDHAADQAARHEELREALSDRDRRLEEARAASTALEAAREQDGRERARLAEELAASRRELHEFRGSRLWKAANLYWRARRFAGRLASPVRRLWPGGSAASDWVGRDVAREAAAAAPAPAIDNRHDVVMFSRESGAKDGGELSALAARLAAAGHRVYRVSRALRRDGPAYAISSRADGITEVSLRAGEGGDGSIDALFGGMDALRRDESLGATLSLVEDSFWEPLAKRLRERCAWPLLTHELPAEAIAEIAEIAGLFPRLSIVIVTHNNRELNRVCLESLAARNEWPNGEIVVVDNASTDGTRDLLQAQARLLGPRLRVLLQDENRGFPAACNAGLAAATGDYLVILNNDTVVTRGAMSALVRHLASDPSLGLVGPVTNAIANEARVEVGYADLAGLPDWARAYVRAHDGETFAIPMLALFCAALPRRVYESVGPLDERFGLGMFEDDDYSRRVAAKGLAVRCARDAFVHHWQMASFRRMPQAEYLALYAENQKKYAQKWGQAPAPRSSAPGDFLAAQMTHLLEKAAASRGAVVFLPSIGWGIHLVQRPHHLARVLARRGYVVVFDCSNADDAVDGFREIEPNLFLFRGRPETLHAIPSPLLWAFPYNAQAAEAYPAGARMIYDWIDDLEVFPYDKALLKRTHERALGRAALVLCVARRLHAEALRSRPDALYVPNGVECERFAAPAPQPQDDALSRFLSGGGPVAGYYGALARWFDYPLLDETARQNPDWRFVLIGQELDQSLAREPLLKRDNVRWLGPRDYATLPGYLAAFDVATIPFRINAITLSTSPLKLFEYFAGGKPVVTTPMPECEAFPEVAIAKDAREFSQALARAREKGKDPGFRERLRSLGRENSWDTRVDTVLAALAAPASALRVGGPPAAPAGEDARGVCNICGEATRFSCPDPALARESLTCAHCLATSRYRSIARGLLEAFRRLAGVDAASLAQLPGGSHRRLAVYDTQTPFSTGASAYPIPDLLAKCPWIDLHLSTLRPGVEAGRPLGERTTNQDLERLTFPDASFDVVVTSDVMEHVRLEDRAHREIRRVLRPGGVYLFTVPHFRDGETLTRVQIVDPDDPSKDRHVMEPEYHGNANAEDGRALAYRAYGIDLDRKLRDLGFSVEYTKQDFPENGIRNTELFFCRVAG